MMIFTKKLHLSWGFFQVVPAGSVSSQEGGGSSPSESGGESGSEGKTYRSKEQLMLRANSLKKALRQIIEQAEKGERDIRLEPSVSYLQLLFD